MCSGQWAIRQELLGVHYLRACLLACMLYLLLYARRLLAFLPALLPACLLAAGLLLFVRWLPARSGRRGVEPTGGAKRNVETRCSKIAHVGIIISWFCRSCGFCLQLRVRSLNSAFQRYAWPLLLGLRTAVQTSCKHGRPGALLGCPLLCWVP